MPAAAPSSARLIPSSQRPVPLRRREDLTVEQIQYRGVGFPVIKDALGLKYFRLQPEQYRVLELLDGTRSLEDVRDELQASHPSLPITPADVQSLVMDLQEKGLLLSERTGQGDALRRVRRERRLRKLRQTLLNPLYLRLPGWDPDRTLARLVRLFGWTLRWWSVVPTLAFVLFAYLFLAVRFDQVRQRLPEFQQFFGWPNLLYLWLTLAGAKVLHEFGHGLACKHFGCECHSMGIMLLVFSPTLYCDVTDSWMLRSKWRRIVIAGAGMYVEVVLAAAAILLWWSTQPGVVNHLCLNVFFVSTVTTVIFNANPLLRFDGYYMLSDLLEIPNLRPKASRLLQQEFARRCLGIELRSDPFLPTSGRVWFVLFALASAVYRWVVVFGIALFFYTVLKPYRLQSLGLTLATLSLATAIGQPLWNLWKLLTMSRAEPLSKPRLSLSLAALVVLVASVLFVPCPWYVAAPFTIEPLDVHHVYAQAGGTLLRSAAAAGEQVEAGILLVELQNEELEQEVRRLRRERLSQSHAVELQLALDDPDRRRIAAAQERSLAAQEQEASRELSKLFVAAPIGGVVVEPPRVPRPPVETSRGQLPGWFGSPLEPRNLGTFVEEGAHLCSIAPSESFQAVLLIEQGDRSEATLGRLVRLKLDHLPDLELSGVIGSLSDQHVEFAPPGLSNKQGGPIATVTDPSGRERLPSPAYQAIVPLNNVDPKLLRTGFRGEARLLVGRRSLGEWLWRSFRTTFKFRL